MIKYTDTANATCPEPWPLSSTFNDNNSNKNNNNKAAMCALQFQILKCSAIPRSSLLPAALSLAL